MYENFGGFIKYLNPKLKADGSVGLPEAIKEFWKYEVTAPIIDQVTGMLNATGKFIVVKGEKSQNLLIRKNPSYKNQFIHDIKIALITGLITLSVGIILWLIDNRSKHQQIQLLQEQIDSVSNRLDRLKK